MARLMGIRPWEIGTMTVGDFDRACDDIDQYLDSGNSTDPELED